MNEYYQSNRSISLTQGVGEQYGHLKEISGYLQEEGKKASSISIMI